MSEHDAHMALSDTARMRRLDHLRDPLEATQRMTPYQKQRRQVEALNMYVGINRFRRLNNFTRFPK